MIKKRYIYWKGWIIVAFSLIIALLALNFVLPLPVLFPVIGDEIQWFQNLSNGIFTLLAAIAGWILQKQYSDKEKAKDLMRQNIRDKIEAQTKKYDELKKIISENLSVLKFETQYTNLLANINPSNNNIDLINKISAYQQQIIDTHNKLKLLYTNEEENAYYIGYEKITKRIIDEYVEILDSFINYLDTTNSYHTTTKEKADIEMPNVGKNEQAMIAAMKCKAVDFMQIGKKHFSEVFKQQKNNLDAHVTVINTTSSALLQYEKNEITELEKELQSIS